MKSAAEQNKRSVTAEVVARLEASFKNEEATSGFDIEHVRPKGWHPQSDVDLMLTDRDGYISYYQLKVGEAIDETLRRLISLKTAVEFGLIPDDDLYSVTVEAPSDDPRAGTSLSTKPLKSKGLRIDRRYTTPSMSAYAHLRQAGQDAGASKAEPEVLQAKPAAKAPKAKLRRSGGNAVAVRPRTDAKPFLSREARKKAMKDDDID